MVDGKKEDKDVVAVIDCIHRAMQCTLWSWEEVSRCFFWRYPTEFMRAIIDVQNKCQVGTWPRFIIPQREWNDSKTSRKEVRKLNKSRKRG